MPTEVKLPHLGESIDSSIILAWHKQVGDAVTRGDELADLETDKATLSLEAPKNGVLPAIVAEVGQTVYLGDLLAVIGKEGETWSESSSDPEQESPAITTVESTVSIPTAKADTKTKYKISPVARRKAKALGVDLARIVPADGAKISGADVDTYAETKAPPKDSRGERRIELSQVKRITGQRMSESAQTVPQFALTIDADIRQLLALRAQANSAGQKLGMTTLLVYLTARALSEHPLLNARFERDGITVFQAAHIGVAAAAEDGLRVPVIHDADQQSLTLIEAKLADLTQKARENRLSLQDISGGTFTISNLGMTGISQFTPLINPLQSAILGVAAPRAVVLPASDSGMYPAQLLSLTVACDHRVLDGAVAAAFLGALKDNIESFELPA